MPLVKQCQHSELGVRSLVMSQKSWQNPKSQLEELINMNADRQDIKRVTDKMNELLYQEEMTWLQRSRITCLKEGDRNTKYFQSKAVWSATMNKIRELTDSIGVVPSDLASMGKLANDYFHDIFSPVPNIDVAPVIDLFVPMVSVEDNIKLCAPFSNKEIADALFQIVPLKAPCPDGFPARFFQRNWSVLKDTVLAAVNELLFLYGYYVGRC